MDDLLEECGIEELYPEYSRVPQVIVEHRSGIGKQTRASKAQLEKLIDDVPDANNPAAINYWVTVGDEEVYLEGWCDKCLAGTGYPPMEGGETLAKLDYMRDMTAGILPRKAKEKGLELIEGGFIELEEVENLYGVTYGVYRRERL